MLIFLHTTEGWFLNGGSEGGFARYQAGIIVCLFSHRASPISRQACHLRPCFLLTSELFYAKHYKVDQSVILRNACQLI